MHTAPGLEPIFAPFDLAGVPLRNRIVMSPMTRQFSPERAPGADVAAYYRRRAAGGVGLIVTEGVGVADSAAVDAPRIPVLHTPGAEAGWRAVVDGVHAEGGRIAVQLWHQGAQRNPLITPADQESPPISPSGYWGTLGVTTYQPDQIAAMQAALQGMTEARIEQVIQAFARSARHARAAGFDAVAIHGAHGYLIDTFLWADTNRRTDAWGGPPRGRARLAAEIIRAIRAEVGPSTPILFRLSQHKQQDYKARLADTPQGLADLLEPLAEAGVDLFDVSARRFYEPHFPGSPRTLAGWVRHLTGRPVMAVGSAGLTPEGQPEAIAALIAAGEIDLIGVGRALLQDPRWPEKVRQGLPTEPVDPASHQRLT